MMDLIFAIVVIIVMVPLIVTPQKVVQRPACKIKNPLVIRILGILVVVVAALMVVF